MGGSSSGGNGGGKNVPGTPIVPSAPKKKKNPVLEFIQGGGVTGAIVRGVTKGIETGKKRKVNTALLGSSDYQGDVEGRKSRVATQDNRNGNGNNQVASTKSIEQPKVASQMDNTEIKSDLITAKGPTSPEIDDDELLLKRKRRGRKTTILTGVTGVEEKPKLGKKVLLG